MAKKVEDVTIKEEKEEKKAKKRKPILLIILILVFIFFLAGGALFFFFGDRLPFIGSSTEEETENVDTLPRYNHAMQEFQVNLADPITRRFLRMKIDLAYDDRGLTRELEERDSELRSHIISILRSKTVDDLDEPGGMKNLEEEILERLNSLLEAGEVRAIYYREFIFQ